MPKKHRFVPVFVACLVSASQGRAQKQALPTIPQVPRDSIILLSVEQRTVKGTQVSFTERSLAQVSLDLAYYYHFDSVAFILPLDTARSYMGGDIEMVEETAASTLAFISQGARVKFAPKKHTLFVWCPNCDADQGHLQLFLH